MQKKRVVMQHMSCNREAFTNTQNQNSLKITEEKVGEVVKKMA